MRYNISCRSIFLYVVLLALTHLLVFTAPEQLFEVVVKRTALILMLVLWIVAADITVNLIRGNKR